MFPMTQSKVFLMLCTVSLLAVAKLGHGAVVANEGSTPRRTDLREALQRRSAAPQESATSANGERQLTTEERAELRRQLRAQLKDQ